MNNIQDLILLGLLKDGEKHPYEIKTIVDEQFQQIAQITAGTVYYTLNRLEKELCVSKKRIKGSNRPDKYVYSITEKGEKKFKELLKKCFFVEDRPYFNFNVGLYFSKYIEKNLILEGVEDKLKNIKTYRKFLKDLENKYPQKWPFGINAIKLQSLLLLDTLEKWYLYLKKELPKKKIK